MAFKLKYKNLKGVVDQLNNSVKAHAKQADIIQDHIDEMEEKGAFQKTSPMKNYRNPQDYKVFNFGNEPTPFEKYKSHAQRKAIWASKNEGGYKKIDPMYNDEPGVQKEDFEQFSNTPMTKKVPNCIPRGSGSKRLSKPSGDPCWDNYVQRGMKEK